jgi:hypothetical protein
VPRTSGALLHTCTLRAKVSECWHRFTSSTDVAGETHDVISWAFEFLGRPVPALSRVSGWVRGWGEGEGRVVRGDEV